METVELMIDREPIRADPSSGTKTILLVDDEEPVQEIVREMLERRGYRVLVAGDGHAALRVSSEFSGDIELLLTDIVMPGMSGLELAKCVSLERPSIKVVYMSGCLEAVVFAEARMSLRRYFLQKPFMAPMLVEKVREALEDHPASIAVRNEVL